MKSLSFIGFPDYGIALTGKLYSHKTQKFLKLRCSKNKYLYTVITHNGIRKTVKSHRLVALAFIPNPENKPQVNHIDGDKQNNHVSNLEWCTASENGLHAFRHNLNKISEKCRKTSSITCKNRIGANHPTAKKIIQFDLAGNPIQTFNSILEAAISVGCHHSSIITACKKEHFTCKKFKWKYLDSI